MTCETPFLTPVGSTTAQIQEGEAETNSSPIDQVAVPEAERFAEDGTPPSGAPLTTTPASGNTCANNVVETTPRQTAHKNSRTEVLKGNIPKYLRYNYYDPTVRLPVTLLQWSYTAKPLPLPPQTELNNFRVTQTLGLHPDLFKIITPIKTDVLERLVASHLNRPFVTSVIQSLKNGFWPYADTKPFTYPLTCDMSLGPPEDENEANFLRAQRDIEIAAERFSHDFGVHLYDGMYSLPIHAVPKPKSTDLRLVTNQSAGPFSLNSMIAYADICGFPMDNMRHLGDLLLQVHDSSQQPLVLWKSDVANAYRLIPMHPRWQIKQVVTIDNHQHIDRCNCFGGRASLNCWGAFNSLVTWSAKDSYDVNAPLCFNDDTYGVNNAEDLLYYKPYARWFPKGQANLL